MTVTWTDTLDNVDWNELSELYRKAPLGDKSPERLKTVFGNSMFVCFVREQGRLVGACRAVADGVDMAYIADVALLPSHQGIGLGKGIVQRLMERSRGHKKIILYSVPGKEAFYQKLGFRKMCTAMAVFEDQDAAARRGFIE